MEPIELIVIAVIVMIAIGMIAALVLNDKAEQRRRALSVIKGHAGGESKEDQRAVADKRRADLAKKLKDQEHGKKSKKSVSLQDQLRMAGMTVSPKQFWMFSVIFAVGAAIGAKIAGFSLFVSAMAFIVGLLGVPRMVIKSKTNKRQKKFLEEFADALEAMVRLLKAGMPVAEAIAMVSKEYTGPVGEEMSIIYDAQRIGVPLAEACQEAARRMPLPEMQMFATGITIQAQTGASLSEILLNLAGVIRARFKLKRKVKSLSAEAKSSAMIIGSLPVVVAGGIWLINPDYIGVMFTTPTGKFMMGGAAVWMCCGVLMMKMMINFKV